MACLDISTNVNLEGVDVDSFFREATTAVANITGKPEKSVMVVLKGSRTITLRENKEPAALGEVLLSIGSMNSEAKSELISSISSILDNHFSIPRDRFFLKVYDNSLATRLSRM
nr:macrophage migration inhibitory factor homolog [Ipomoea trifida]GMD40034.1 macrophage migration inhibitory factor homolog [Ipomoea batatas]GME08821.1 macrophage migration inhibitory factor homolog [Ipomoea batatas]GME16103.1 macrophage migration inhibitory factor homolog [Ipomoea batatas]